MSIRRRQFLTGSLLGSALASASHIPWIRLAHAGDEDVDYVLVAEEAPLELVKGHTTAALAYNGQFPAPVLRARQGERLRVKLVNRLQQGTTIHWHGIRIDFAMDGVPWLSQPPVMPGESFIYDFVCPDAGTFWYHPHTHSLEQLGKGLVGCLVVDEPVSPGFDHDLVLSLKDWHLDKQGQWTALTTPRNAARMGTLGRLQTVNGIDITQKPVFDVPAGASVRLRFANLDNTRLYQLSLKDYPAMVLSEEGIALAKPYPLTTRGTAPGMRIDVGLLTPSAEGETIPVYDKMGEWYVEICRLRTVANPAMKTNPTLPGLPYHDIPEPDLDNAETLEFVFEWEGALTPASAGKALPDFWTINRRAWEGIQQGNKPAPLAELTLGKSYILDLYNASQHHHPIHLHGYSFKVLSSSRREITPYFTDTILLGKNERARVAFVADNPGEWMFHCHVIEHMKTGLMGYIRVSQGNIL